MAKLAFPTSREVPGPLLIDTHQLYALDEIIDRHAAALRQHRDAEIEASIENEIQRRLASKTLAEEDIEEYRARIRRSRLSFSGRLQRDSVSVALYLKGGREVQAERFAEAINQPVSEEESPVGLGLYLTIGSVRAVIRLADEQWRQRLSIQVEPNNSEVAQSLFGALNNWASDVQAPKWQQRWLSGRSYLRFALVVWLLVGFILGPLLGWSIAGEYASTIEARRLLSQGINANNQQRAIELILAIESGYYAGERRSRPGPRYWSYATLGALCLVCASICPRICIGAWRGKRQVERWRDWIKAVRITIPGLVASSLVLPWVLHILGLNPPSP